VGNYNVLQVVAPGIRHIRLFQPGDNPGDADGLQFDDLVLLGASTGVPGPATGLSWARVKSQFSGPR
jgi:hypothetical protein